MIRIACLIVALGVASIAHAKDMVAREGWAVLPTGKSYDQLVTDVKAAVKENGLIVVTQAGPTKAAAARGITIPGNRVIGVFNNDFAVRVLNTSTAAMIEAPIRLYVTENADGTATLSYKTPSFVFAPYAEGGTELQAIALELDGRFDAIAKSAVTSQ
ncbi:DUF302 domain-containing protein [Ruegeria sp. 2205SS24-7]|uniref:DUF302 domain-containing protein n=1 Tax=Ruegeria discodermiae TaxID=3064389 RepID=UPI0027408CFB|nr:DUF302 domain-containing protein [Ruegeria sp. 2205SS24-7]MDP5216915.1 DUF302 domain-containing protein [Ruegeria sp. 2205SS24-7]